jgi:secondary thiamine-phosphate synthase enzyme
MIWIQKEIQIQKKPRGFHLIDEEILLNFEEIKKIKIGISHIFIKHTSASLTLNENADHTVRDDFESHFNEMVPENQPYYRHVMEGPDDMPAHIKASLLGSHVEIPISSGRLNMGIWQGIYLCEHRNHGGPRKLILTAYGQEN